jgi:non-canonical poly(A) RNA polymerase PAPD5/7
MLVLQDPADPLNDLGRKAFGYKHIRATISKLKRQLDHTMTMGPPRPDFSLLNEFVGPCYEAYKGRRAIAEAYGQAAVAENWSVNDVGRIVKEQASENTDGEASAAEASGGVEPKN